MSFQRLFKNYSLLARLAFSALCVICVPLLVFAWVSLDQSSRRLTEQENVRHLQIAGQFSSYFQAQRTNMVAIAARMTYEDDISAPFLWADKYDEIEMIKTLRHYCNLSSISVNCYLYFRGSDFLIGSDCKYDRDIFFSDTLGFVRSERAREQLSFALDEADGPTTFTNSSAPDERSCMYVSVPFTLSRQNDSVVLFVVNRLSLNDSFLGELNSGVYELYVFDSDDRLLVSNAGTLYPYLDSPALAEFLASSGSSCRFALNDGERTLYKIHNSQLDMSFVTMPVSDAVSDALSSFYRLARLMILLLTLLMLFLLAAFVYINYKPVLETTRRIRSRYGGDYDMGGELDFIEYAFDQKFSENAAMLDQLAEQQLQLIDYTVKSILSGKTPTDDELLRCGLSPTQQNYLVLSVRTMTGEPPAGINDGLRLSLKALAAELCGAELCIIDSVEDCIVLLFSLDALDGELLSRVAAPVYDTLHAALDCPLILGAGTVESSRSRICTSYINSTIALEHVSRPGIFRFEDIVAFESKPEAYPAESALHFYQYIRQGDCASAMKEYDAVIEHVSGIRSTVFEHYVRYDVITSFLKTLNELSVPVSPDERSELLALGSYPELRENVAAITARACGEVIERRRSFNQTRMGRIVDYIGKNSSDPELGLPMIAAHFGMSMSSLSSGFNEAMGRGLREYIVERRLEHAKALLTESRFSIKEIAVRVGFRDVSYFIKLFKAATGCTPVIYRETSK